MYANKQVRPMKLSCPSQIKSNNKIKKHLLNTLNVNVNNGAVWLGLEVEITRLFTFSQPLLTLILNPSSFLPIPYSYSQTPDPLILTRCALTCCSITFALIFRAFIRRFFPNECCQKKEKRQYIAVGTVRLFIETSTKQ